MKYASVSSEELYVLLKIYAERWVSGMVGFGTIINVAAIVAGGCVGLVFGGRLTERCQETLIKTIGAAVVFVGVGGTLQQMLHIEDGTITMTGTMMMIISLAIGALLGEWFDLDRRMDEFGRWLRTRTGNEKDTLFVDGFVIASLTVCIGAMAVVGSIEDGIHGNYSILAAKAVLDMIIVMTMTAAMGKGCIFSAIPVGIFQGTITLLAGALSPIITDVAMSDLSYVGNIMIFLVGVNLLFDQKVRVANLLPALLIAYSWSFVVK